MIKKPAFISRLLIALVSAALIWTLPLAGAAAPQVSSANPATIEAGTTIYVRTTEEIDADAATGQTFPGVVDRDVVNSQGVVVIPKGSDVELIVRQVSGDQLALDLNSITINGQRYGVEAGQSVVTPEGNAGLGANKRTATYVGGGAVLGAIIGAIAGGGKGAAIGAGAGAAAGAVGQVLTKGKNVHVPDETLLTFDLTQPLQPLGVATTSSLNQNQDVSSQEIQSLPYSPGLAAIYIGPDKTVSWQGPQNVRVYVQSDTQAPTLFAVGGSGFQSASWMMPGHVYVFMMRDANGKEIARSQVDLRPTS